MGVHLVMTDMMDEGCMCPDTTGGHFQLSAREKRLFSCMIPMYFCVGSY